MYSIGAESIPSGIRRNEGTRTMREGMILFALAGTVAAGTAMAANAQPARTSPDQIVCAMTGSCSDQALSTDRRLTVGQERSFSLVKPTTAAPAAPAAKAMPPRDRAVSRTATLRQPPPKPASGRLEMLVNFPLGSADLTEASKVEVKSFATAMMSPALQNMRFNVEGHTDSQGARDYNLDLSRRRAQTVVDYLVSLGIDRSRLQAEGFGFDKPRPGLTASAPGNRRVEFVKAG